jgi:hypothetical protein
MSKTSTKVRFAVAVVSVVVATARLTTPNIASGSHPSTLEADTHVSKGEWSRSFRPPRIPGTRASRDIQTDASLTPSL